MGLLCGENEVEVRANSDEVVNGRTNLPLVHEGDDLFHVAQHQETQVAARSLGASEPGAEYEIGLTSELAEEPPIV